MLSNTKLYFFSRLISLSAIFYLISLIDQNSYCLDLTIDLPKGAGKSPILYYKPNSKPFLIENSKSQDLGKILQKSTGKNKNESVEAGLSTNDIPPPPPILQNNKVTINPVNSGFAIKNASIIPNDKIFPELICLKDNIDFWERVYNDIDSNEGIVHDRNNLGRIYAIVSLPRNERDKLLFMKNEKKKIEIILLSLAKKIRLNETLNRNEKEISKLFPKNALTYKKVIEAVADVRIQTGLKSQFAAGIQRSMNYIPVVLPIVKKSGLPFDLAYLPHVESSYNSRAGSKVGAVGLWQLMPSTMRLLEGNAAVYKRTDPGISTKAAMKLLKENYQKTGSWPLALTAYNHGANGVIRAMEITKSRDLCEIIERYNSPSFKFASSNFYAQFLAARRVALRKYKTLAQTQNNSVLNYTLLKAKGDTL